MRAKAAVRREFLSKTAHHQSGHHGERKVKRIRTFLLLFRKSSSDT
jgi:hypothetical protein